MSELSINCLPFSMTSVEKNVYPVSSTRTDSSGDADNDDVITEYFAGEITIILVDSQLNDVILFRLSVAMCYRDGHLLRKVADLLSNYFSGFSYR